MKKNLLTFLLLVVVCNLHATNYYVSGATGNDANNGLSGTAAFKTIQPAADRTLPGDTVFVLNGTYTNLFPDWSVVNIERSGTASDWITYTNYPGDNPIISFTGGGGFNLGKGASYITINGFTIKGNNDNISLDDALNQPGSCNNPNGAVSPLYNGNGISIYGEPNIGNIHHIIISNNEIYNCPAGGIYGARCDYVTIENNKIYNNAWYTIYGSSGIAFYQNWNYDTNQTVYRIKIQKNLLSGNMNLVPWLVNCQIGDGNGIIIDDSKQTQNSSTLSPYQGRTLIANNISSGNGGPGVHIYFSEHIDVVNNSTYFNQQTPENLNGEIDAQESNDVVIRNNIMYAKDGKPINTSLHNTNITHDHNIYFGGNGNSVNGLNTVTANPQYLNPGLSINSDFKISGTSPAIDNGTSELAPAIDFNNHARPLGSGFDIGAYEVEASGTLAVTLLSLSGSLVQNDVTLNWKALQEQSAAYFAVQRSFDAIHFDSIGKLDAAGNSVNISSYNFIDKSVSRTSVPKLYYRVKEVDKDGTINMSNTLLIKVLSPGSKIAIFPNPASRVINLLSNESLGNNAYLNLYDITGRLALHQKLFPFGSHQYLLGNLSSGNYRIVIWKDKQKFDEQSVIITK